MDGGALETEILDVVEVLPQSTIDSWLKGRNEDICAGRVVTPLVLRQLMSAFEKSGATVFPHTNFADCTFSDARFEGITFGLVNFERTIWQESLQLVNVKFSATTSFENAIFCDWVIARDLQCDSFMDFSGSRFLENVVFRGSTFRQAALFRNVKFAGRADFSNVTFLSGAQFQGSRFVVHARFDDCSLLGNCILANCEFLGGSDFSRAKFGTRVIFQGCKFYEEPDFDGLVASGGFIFSGVWIGSDWHLQQADFKSTCRLGPMVVAGLLRISDVTVAGRAEIEFIARDATMSACSLKEGGQISTVWTGLNLRNSRFGGPTYVHGEEGFFSRFRGSPVDLLKNSRPQKTAGGRLLTLSGTTCTNLILADVDLRDCDFTYAHSIDSIRIEPQCSWRRVGGRMSGRRVIAQDVDALPARVRWRPRAKVHSAERGGQHAAIYRGLRESFESHSDQPGASDIYFGEMQARRRSRSTPYPEKSILFAYWLISGYGLRASRALIAAVFSLIVLSLALARSVPNELSFAEAAVALARSSIGLGGTLLRDLGSQTASALELLARLIFPVLLGLAALAVRGRVRR